MSKVFVYGTLKQGFNNEPLLGGQKFLGRGVTADSRFKLFESREHYYPFPTLVVAEGGYQVYGEVYDVSERCLVDLDRLEGVNHGLYERHSVKVVLEDGTIEENVIAYRYLQSYSKYPHVGQVWPIKELSNYRFNGKKIVVTPQELEFDGVALWNKRNCAWATSTFENEDELKNYCRRHRAKLGVQDLTSGTLWSQQYFEVRNNKGTKSVTQFEVTDIVTGTKWIANDRNGLAQQLTDNTTFFGGEKGTLADWQKVLSELLPPTDQII